MRMCSRKHKFIPNLSIMLKWLFYLHLYKKYLPPCLCDVINELFQLSFIFFTWKETQLRSKLKQENEKRKAEIVEPRKN